MEIQNWLLELNKLGEIQLTLLFLVENLVLIILSGIIGKIIEAENTVLYRKDLKWIFSTLVFNTLITYIGYKMFCHDHIQFYFNFSIISIITDLLLITLIMDFLMFIFHYIIHRVKWLYTIHNHHHLHVKTNVYSLYVLHPIETLGFGFLWLISITLIHFNFYGMVIYLILNLTYGILGHLQKDIFPDFWSDNYFTKWISTTQFHNNHHLNKDENFGFYFTFWDKLLNTHSSNKKTHNS